jgi:hypothetical protein
LEAPFVLASLSLKAKVFFSISTLLLWQFYPHRIESAASTRGIIPGLIGDLKHLLLAMVAVIPALHVIAIISIATVGASRGRDTVARRPFGAAISSLVGQLEREGLSFPHYFSYVADISAFGCNYIRRLGVSPKPRLTPVLVCFNPIGLFFYLTAMQRPVSEANGGVAAPGFGAATAACVPSTVRANSIRTG